MNLRFMNSKPEDTDQQRTPHINLEYLLKKGIQQPSFPPLILEAQLELSEDPVGRCIAARYALETFFQKIPELLVGRKDAEPHEVFAALQQQGALSDEVCSCFDKVLAIKKELELKGPPKSSPRPEEQIWYEERFKHLAAAMQQMEKFLGIAKKQDALRTQMQTFYKIAPEEGDALNELFKGNWTQEGEAALQKIIPAVGKTFGNRAQLTALLENIARYHHLREKRDKKTEEQKEVIELWITINYRTHLLTQIRPRVRETIPKTRNEHAWLRKVWWKTLRDEVCRRPLLTPEKAYAIAPDDTLFIRAALSGNRQLQEAAQESQYFRSLFITVGGSSYYPLTAITPHYFATADALLTHLLHEHNTNTGKKTQAEILLDSARGSPLEKIIEIAQTQIISRKEGKALRALAPLLIELDLTENHTRAPRARVIPASDDPLKLFDTKRYTGICTKGNGKYADEAYRDGPDPAVFYLEEEVLEGGEWRLLAEACIIDARNTKKKRTWVVETISAVETLAHTVSEAYWMHIMHDGIVRAAQLENVGTIIYNISLEARNYARRFVRYIAEQEGYITPEGTTAYPELLSLDAELVEEGKKRDVLTQELHKMGVQRIGYFQSWNNEYNTGSFPHPRFQCRENPNFNNAWGYVRGIPIAVKQPTEEYPDDLMQASLHIALRNPERHAQMDEGFREALATHWLPWWRKRNMHVYHTMKKVLNNKVGKAHSLL